MVVWITALDKKSKMCYNINVRWVEYHGPCHQAIVRPYRTQKTGSGMGTTPAHNH